jgi:hypothetical protein
MINLKNICLVLMMFSFICCTEIYDPDIDTETKAIIVEGLITDGDGPFSIKLSEALPYSFDSVSSNRPLTKAKLKVIDNENNTYELTEAESGNYVLPSSFKAKTGRSYTLHIETKNGIIYESNSEILMPSTTYDSIHGVFDTEDYIRDDNILRTAGGAKVLVDLFGNIPASETRSLCRFNSDITVQYSYTYRESDEWHFFYFGWRHFELNSDENLTEERSLTSSPSIKNHTLCFVPMGTSSYGFNTPYNTSVIYYVRFRQYTINQDSYDFYKKANEQLAASGKMFDPITTQLYGNIKCVSDPKKIALGLFEVSSVKQDAFIVDAYTSEVIIKTVPYADVSEYGWFHYKVWDYEPNLKPKDPMYDVIPFPDWWYHN